MRTFVPEATTVAGSICVPSTAALAAVMAARLSALVKRITGGCAPAAPCTLRPTSMFALVPLAGMMFTVSVSSRRSWPVPSTAKVPFSRSTFVVLVAVSAGAAICFTSAVARGRRRRSTVAVFMNFGGEVAGCHSGSGARRRGW